MQLRISQGPTSALGIGEVVKPEEVRAAFLGLTKQFHPARFGRLSPDLQKLANEVFLGIKAAHDHMLKVLGSSTTAARGGSSAAPRSGGIPVVGEGTNRTPTPSPRGTQSMPKLDPGTSPPHRASTPTGRPITPPTGVPVIRATTPSGQVPRPTGSIPSQHRPTTPPVGQPTTSRTLTPIPPGTQPGVMPPGQAAQQGVRQPTPGGGTQPLSRAPVPPGTQPGVAPTNPGPPGANPPAQSNRMMRVRTSTGSMINMPSNQVPGARPPTLRPGQTSPLAPGAARPPTLKPGETSPLVPTRPATLKPGETSPLAPTRPVTLKPGETSPLAPPTSPPRPVDYNPPTARTGASAGTPAFDEDGAFREATALMERKDWTGARQALHALAPKVPQSKTYRAWLCYARGREAYLQGQTEAAIVEMQRALQLEPDLAHAKHALAELQRRR